MANPHLQINERDLGAFLRVAHDDGLDPADSAFADPQFSGSPAFGEGAAWVSDAVGNREMVFPLFLSAESEADLHQLIRDINGELARGASVEYASQSSADISYFDLERGRLEVDYKYWISRLARCRATLSLYVRPFAHTGTARLLASAVATQAVAQITASQISGDVDAQVNLRVTNVSAASRGLAIGGYGVKYPVPSGFSPQLAPGPLASMAISTASVFGASGRSASQYAGFAPPQATQSLLASMPLRMQDAGRYRLLALMSATLAGSAYGPNLQLIKDDSSVAKLPLLASDMALYRWRDLGEYSIEPSTVGQSVALRYVATSGVTAGATYPIRIDQLLSLPVDRSAAVLSMLNGSQMLGATEAWLYQGVGNDTAAKVLNASGIRADLTTMVRGGPMELPPVPTGAPSGAVQIVVFHAQDDAGGTKDMIGANSFGVSIEVRERFRFLR